MKDESVRRFLDYDHIKNLNATKFGEIAFNKEELVKYIHQYTKNPSMDEKERMRLVKEQIWKLDGKSGQRIADFIYEQL